MQRKPFISYVLYTFSILLFVVGLINSARNDTDESEKESVTSSYHLYLDIQPPPKFETFEPVKLTPLPIVTSPSSAEYKEHSYIITYSARLKSNNHVGDSWRYGITYDGEFISSGSVIEFKEGFPLTIQAFAKEIDSYNDYGSARVTFESLAVGKKQSKEVIVTVRENRGRYAGNTAQWSFNITIERIS